jgi:hypothetical protein
MSLANLIKKGSLRSLATATPATPATVSPNIPPSVATVATVAVAKATDKAANDPAPDTDRWCWPHSSAMNTVEIDIFMVRLRTFADKGLPTNEAETLADKLALRDRESDDRRVCLECQHFAGQGAGSWRCGNWQTAGVAIRSRDAQLPGDLVVQLQRCDGFTAQPTIHTTRDRR